MRILTHAFFAETFQPMNTALTFQIGLNDCARAIRGKFTFAVPGEVFRESGPSINKLKSICFVSFIYHHIYEHSTGNVTKFMQLSFQY